MSWTLPAKALKSPITPPLVSLAPSRWMRTPSRVLASPPSVSRGLALGLAAALCAGCGADAPTLPEARSAPKPGAAAPSHSISSGPSVLSPSETARVLDELRARSARWHDPQEAIAAGFTFDVGCVDERAVEGVGAENARGMGRHLVNLAREFDGGHVSLLEPEIALYARNENSGKLRLAGLDYVVHESDVPSPEDGGEPPVMPELGLPFHWSPAHGVWMFHIWLWWQNPDGMFADWNPTVPLCDCEITPETGRCFPG